MLTVQACAKVNLTLEVLGKRRDGYHDIASVMQEIDLCDTVAIEPHADIHLDCSVPSLNTPQNLALRAAHALAEATGCRQGAFIYVHKRIPESGGLGGGSSDAAAVLRGLNQLWGLDLPREKLAEIGAGLGSDVPFFVFGGTALAEGRGEKITPLTRTRKTGLVLLIPEMSMPNKTASLYARIDREFHTHGEATEQLRRRLEKGQPLAESELFNVFEKVAFEAFPGLSEYRQQFLEAGARSVHLAGSGPTLFTLAADEHETHEIVHRLSAMGLRAEHAHTV